MKESPHVYLVGAGPGDPELLTMKANRLLQEADVVVFDRLVSAEILALVPAGTAKFYVGKTSGHHHMTQDEINALLVQLARAGKTRIVRLKGGDPLIFGRGSEEALYLREHGIPFSIVPGISSASACTTYAGIPLTHRGLAKSVRMVTGHCQKNRPLDLNWKSLSDPDTTLVIYMGLGHLQEITTNLECAGLLGSTPAAIIENGTHANQRRCITTLAQLADQARIQNFTTPSLIIIGRVVALAKQLEWRQTSDNEQVYEETVGVSARAEA